MPDPRAELDVVDVLRDRRVLAADRAVRVAPQLHLRELARERVVQQEAADKRVADPERELQRFGGLDRADHAREHTEYAALGTARSHLRRRRLREQAAVARAGAGLEDRHLALEPED